MNEQTEKYFKDLKDVILIQVELTEHPCEIDENDEWLVEILKQIALDQREACAVIAQATFDNPPCTSRMPLIEQIVNAIRNAEISNVE